MDNEPSDNTPPPPLPAQPPICIKQSSGFMSNLISTLLGTVLGITAAWGIYFLQKSDASKSDQMQNTEALNRVSVLLEGQFANEIRAQQLFVQMGLIQECQGELADGVAKLRSVTSPIFFGKPSKEMFDNAKWECHQYTGTAASMHASVHRLKTLISDYEVNFDNATKPLLNTVSEKDTGAIRQLNDTIELFSELKGDQIPHSSSEREAAGVLLLGQLDNALSEVRAELDLISKVILDSESNKEDPAVEQISTSIED